LLQEDEPTLEPLSVVALQELCRLFAVLQTQRVQPER
jgi:hypothetical protein